MPDMDDSLKRLESLLSLVDTKSTMDEFVQAFSLVLDFIGKQNTATAEKLDSLEEYAKDGIQRVTDFNEEKWKEVLARVAKLKDGAPGVPGLDGRDADEQKIIQVVLSHIPKPKDGTDGKDGSPDTPDQIVEKVNQSSTLISRSKVEGLEDAIRMASANAGSVPITTAFYNGLRGKNLTIVGGTATQQGDTVFVTVSSSGSNLSLTTTGTSGAATYNSGTGVLNIPIYSAGSGGISRSINTVSTTTAAGATASTDYVYLCSGTFTITLPTTVGNTNLYTIKNIGAGVITVATTGGETIDGSATAPIPVQWTSYDFIASSGNWNVV